MISPRADSACSVGVDIGGTKMAAALVRRDGTAGEPIRVPTPSGAAIPEAVAALVGPLIREHDVRAVGISIAGFVADDSRTVAFSPNIDDWQAGDLAGPLESLLRRPVVVENDANCAAWGEAVHGAGRGARNLVCLTVGTGLGGGIVADGRLVRGSSGFAGEFGHMVLVPGGRPCPCGGLGCWEQYVSGRALLRAYHDAGVRTGDEERADGRAVTVAARGGDPAGLAAFATVGACLGRGLAALTTVLDPMLFVVGGGVAEAGPLLLDPARHAYEEALTPKQPFRSPARVVPATLGNMAGVVGVADLAMRHGER